MRRVDGVIPTLAVVEEPTGTGRWRCTWCGKYQKRQGQTIVISTAGEPGSEFELRREQIRQRGQVTRDGSFTRAESAGFARVGVAGGRGPGGCGGGRPRQPVLWHHCAVARGEVHAAGSSMQHWRRFTCNLPTRSDVAAIQEKEWFDARTDDRVPEGEPVWAGLDLGWKYDTTAIVPCGCGPLSPRFSARHAYSHRPGTGTS